MNLVEVCHASLKREACDTPDQGPLAERDWLWQFAGDERIFVLINEDGSMTDYTRRLLKRHYVELLKRGLLK